MTWYKLEMSSQGEANCKQFTIQTVKGDNIDTDITQTTNMYINVNLKKVDFGPVTVVSVWKQNRTGTMYNKYDFNGYFEHPSKPTLLFPNTVRLDSCIFSHLNPKFLLKEVTPPEELLTKTTNAFWDYLPSWPVILGGTTKELAMFKVYVKN